jgi:hypothetical protein
MAETLDLNWFPFDLADGQRLVLDVNWGAGGESRAETSLSVYDQSGTVVTASQSPGGWSGAELVGAESPMWISSGDDEAFVGEYTWLVDDQGGLVLIDPDAVVSGGAVADFPPEGLGGLLAGGDVVFGGDISMGDVRIGGTDEETYRITSENAGETVTILDFPGGEGGAVLDITDLLATGAETLDVSYDSTTESSTLTVSGATAADTIIVVQGVDLTTDFDTYVVTDTVI